MSVTSATAPFIDVSAADAADFVQGGGIQLLCFHAPSQEPSRALVPVLREVAERSRGAVRVGGLDLDAHPGVVDSFRLTACPTVDVFVGGRAQARLVGLSSAEHLLSQMAQVGVTLPGEPAPRVQRSPLFERVEALAQAIDDFEEERAVRALEREVSQHGAAFRRLDPALAPRAAQRFAPAYFACVRELALLARFLVRELKRVALPSPQRVGVATALSYFATTPPGSEAVQASGGACFLDDWLVLHMARVLFVDRMETDPESMRFQTLAAFIRSALPDDEVPGLATAVASLGELQDALRRTPYGASDELLEHLVQRPVPFVFIPPVLPPPRRGPVTGPGATGEPPVARGWKKQAVALELCEPGGACMRFEDGSALWTKGHAVVTEPPRPG